MPRDPFRLAMWFVAGLFGLAVAARIYAIVRRGDTNARGVANLTEEIAHRARFAIGGALGFLLVPPMIKATYEQYGDLAWASRAAGVLISAGCLYALWVAVRPAGPRPRR
ncbi:MAG: hypothetical protein M0D55_01125 [Elusimicrobiota bacterium]|nr:MAG: hypothetical protein M0D55_01125 [Elusimicrobiota bacterium]